MSRTTLALVTVLVVTLLGAALLAPVVAGQEGPQTANETATSTPTATPSPTPNSETQTPTTTPTPDAGGQKYSLSELQRGGQQPSSAPSSVRYLPDREGAVAIRYTPAAPLENDLTFLEPGSTVNTDDLQLYATRFGVQGDQQVTVRAVFYTTATRTDENGTTRRVATNIRERTYQMSLGYGYSTANFTLPNHFQEPTKTLLILEQGGEPVEGARWTFVHQTVQSEQAPATTIDSRGDLWRWAGINIFSVLIPGLLVSAVGVKAVIRQTGRGPDKSLTWWGMFVIAPLLFLVATVGFFRTAQVAARIPQIFGFLAVLVGAIAMLETMGRKRRTDEFVRDELEDAQAPLGDALRNVVYEDKKRVYTVQRDDGLGLIKTGIRPFLARLFARPAVLDTKQLKTQIEVQGPDDKKFIADPDSDQPLQWTPAHFEIQWSLFRDGEGSALERFRWPPVVGALIGTGIGYAIGLILFDVGTLTAIAGAGIMFLAVATKARDGSCSFEPAPVHYSSARATISARQVAKRDAESVRDLHKENWSIRSNAAKEIKELAQERDKTVTQRLAAEEAGVDVFELDLTDDDTDPNPDDDSARTKAKSKKGSEGKDGVIDFQDDDSAANGHKDGGDDDE